MAKAVFWCQKTDRWGVEFVGFVGEYVLFNVYEKSGYGCVASTNLPGVDVWGSPPYQSIDAAKSACERTYTNFLRAVNAVPAKKPSALTWIELPGDDWDVYIGQTIAFRLRHEHYGRRAVRVEDLRSGIDRPPWDLRDNMRQAQALVRKKWKGRD